MYTENVAQSTQDTRKKCFAAVPTMEQVQRIVRGLEKQLEDDFYKEPRRTRGPIEKSSHHQVANALEDIYSQFYKVQEQKDPKLQRLELDRLAAAIRGHSERVNFFLELAALDREGKGG